jgi:CNT family concentrative nucleoside transporter
MAGYAAMGIQLEYLLAACFMAAPGGLMMAKIIIPETGEPKNQLDELSEEDNEVYVNVFDAAATGALSGLQLALNVGAMLLAFTALIAMLNAIVGWAGSVIGFDGLTIEVLLGYAFQPIAWTLGVPWSEANIAGSLIGQKIVFTEFLAYIGFTAVMGELSNLSQAIITIALCGFANFASIAILLGGLGTLAPTRRTEIAQLGMRALVAATLANLMSAAIAGFFLSLG